MGGWRAIDWIKVRAFVDARRKSGCFLNRSGLVSWKGGFLSSSVVGFAFKSVGFKGLSWSRSFFDEILNSFLSQCGSEPSKFDFGDEKLLIPVLARFCSISSEVNGDLEQG